MYQKWCNKQTVEYEGIEKKCEISHIDAELKKLLPEENLRVISASVNKTGVYNNPLEKNYPPQYAFMFKVEGLPEYCEIVVERISEGGNAVNTIIWLPVAWNARFVATAGAGNRTGGYFQMGRPNNDGRGMTLPVAVINGFMSATTDGGIYEDGRWAMHNERNEFNEDLTKEWAYLATHKMTVVAKAIAKILYGKYPDYSYIHGASGGGRQSLMEAQRYPKDFDGIWASCPAINWNKFIVGNLWVKAVLNESKAELTPAKLLAFENAVQSKYGGAERFYSMTEIPEYDPFLLNGTETEDGTITENDCFTLKEIMRGPQDKDGKKLWYYFRPGTHFWNGEGPAACALYFVPDENGNKKLKMFSLCSDYVGGWLDRSLTTTYDDITKEEFYRLMDEAESKFSYLNTDNADLTAFKNEGGKLVIDHGTGDPLVPCDGTLDYYYRVTKFFGGEQESKQFFRMYFCPGDGHGNCYSYGPGLTEDVCMNALMDWVENGIAPETLPGVRIDEKSGEVLEKRDLHVL